MKKSQWIGIAASFLVMGAMGFLAEYTNTREFIFPEATALLTGAFLMKKMPWNVRHGMMTVIMTLCAAAGIVISRSPLPLYVKLACAVAVVILLLGITGTSMTPAVSACALPVLIGTTDWIYVLTVFVLALVCDTGNLAMEHAGLMERQLYVSGKISGMVWLRKYLVFAVILILPAVTEQWYLIVPPLIVAYLALSDEQSLFAQRPVLSVLLFTAASVIGFVCRIIYEESPLPMTLCILLAAAMIWMVFAITRLPFPPAAAIAILPFLLPYDGLWRYPVEVTAGILILLAGSRLVIAWNRRSDSNK